MCGDDDHFTSVVRSSSGHSLQSRSHRSPCGHSPRVGRVACHTHRARIHRDLWVTILLGYYLPIGIYSSQFHACTTIHYHKKMNNQYVSITLIY